MKVLVTGSEGFIGKHVVAALKGHEVVGFDLKSGQDVRDRIVVERAVARADAVVHLAALCHGVESYRDPRSFFETNEAGTFNVFEAARKRAAGRGTSASGPPRVVFAASAASLDPRRPYGLTKLHSEQWGCVYREAFSVPVCNLRFFNVYGPGDDKSVVNIFVKNALAGKKLVVYGDGKQTRDFIHVSDLARAIAEFATGKRAAGDYDLASGKKVTVNAVAALVQKLVAPVGVEHAEALPGEIRDSGSQKPWPVRTSLEQGIRGLKEYYEDGGE